MTHFSREIARNARNLMYQFLASLDLNLTKVGAFFGENYFHSNMKQCNTNFSYILYFQKTCTNYLKYFFKIFYIIFIIDELKVEM